MRDKDQSHAARQRNTNANEVLLLLQSLDGFLRKDWFLLC
jgi:hypothetical protein